MPQQLAPPPPHQKKTPKLISFIYFEILRYYYNISAAHIGTLFIIKKTHSEIIGQILYTT